MLKRIFLIFCSVLLLTSCAKQVSPAKVVEKTAENTRFLFVRDDSRVMIYADNKNAEEIDKLNQTKYLFGYYDKNIIFLDNDLFLNTFNIESKQIKKLPIASVSPEYNGYNSGFVVTENSTLYFLKGGCAEIYTSCDLYSFNLTNNKETLLHKNVTFPKHGGVGINNFDKEKNALIIISGWGDAGWASMEIYEYDIGKKELRLTKKLERCNEASEDCNESDNKPYEEARIKFTERPEVVTCSGKMMSAENKGVFISCIE